MQAVTSRSIWVPEGLGERIRVVQDVSSRNEQGCDSSLKAEKRSDAFSSAVVPQNRDVLSVQKTNVFCTFLFAEIKQKPNRHGGIKKRRAYAL